MKSEIHEYRDRRLIVIPGWRVAVFKDENELYSTAADFALKEDALKAARALVDTEIDGHRVTPPTNDPVRT